MIPSELNQVSIFNVRQLRDRGIGQDEIRRELSQGGLVRLKRGWYTSLNPEQPAERHRLRVLTELADHPDTVASHYSGAVQLKLPVHRPDWSRIHLMRIGPGPAQNRAHVVIHRRVADADGTDPALIIAQTALFCPVSGLMALDKALALGLVSLAAFDVWSKKLGGRPGHQRLRVVRRLADQRRESPLESRTALTFDRWGHQLEPQFHVPGTDYRADARISGTSVLVECDGLGKYDEPGSEAREKVREDEIRALDWEVVRVTTALLDDPSVLARRVKAAIERSRRRVDARISA
ncbi:MAG: hypothetical protein QM619_04960 [Micropruina sp.]|uniref:hypothetical protein n=1 Tax=Micropruina sp. TaxID=2737536 RepID=UPI0039E23FD4